uniref:Uncharacterized protein n=1 Tax=Periophthalmus magnuspinnatus TaxID=409849 RepID=A0A3B4AKJ1_9GOBI
MWLCNWNPEGGKDFLGEIPTLKAERFRTILVPFAPLKPLMPRNLIPGGPWGPLNPGSPLGPGIPGSPLTPTGPGIPCLPLLPGIPMGP